MPPNQFAQVRSCTPGVLLIVSAWLVGIEKMSDVDRIVTMRVEELASVPALKPSSTARSAANRNTAIATLRMVSAVRRLLRRALFSTRPRNFIAVPGDPERVAPHDVSNRPDPPDPPDPPDLPDPRLLDERALLQMQEVRRALRRVRIVRHHHDRLL